MKKCLFLLMLLPGAVFSYGQVKEDMVWNRTTVDKVTGNLVYLFQYIDIKGSQFLNEDWMPGEIIMNDQNVYRNLELKYDAYNGEFAMNRHDTAYRVSTAAPEIHLYTKGGDSLVFKNKFAVNNHITADKYLQVLAQGKISLLKFIKSDIEEYSEYGDATKYKRFVKREEYFLLKDGVYSTTRLTKKDLETLSGEKWDKVSSYLSQNNMSGKDEKSFVSAISFYNSL